MYFKKITIKIQTFMEAIGNLKIIKNKKERKRISLDCILTRCLKTLIVLGMKLKIKFWKKIFNNQQIFHKDKK